MTLDVQQNVTTVDNTVDVLSASQFRSVVRDNFPDRLDELGNANTNWQDEIYRNAKSSDINLSLRGALFGEIPARLSLNRSDQQGLRRVSN